MDPSTIRQYSTGSRVPFFKVAEKYLRLDSRILDIGAGDGAFARAINRPDTYMIDSNPKSVEQMKDTFPNVSLGTIPPIPFEDGYFDMIHCSHIVEHLLPHELYDLMLEWDRCLANHGVIIISTPLMWDSFYNDLSHVKPYNPEVFRKYLTSGTQQCATRKLVSADYEVKELLYRYQLAPVTNQRVFEVSTWWNKSIEWWWETMDKFRFKMGIRKPIPNAYTLVLRKKAYNS